MRYTLPMKGYKFINLLFVNVREIEKLSDTTVRALCHMQLFGFHVTPVCFSLRAVDFYTVTGCFLYPPPGLQAHLSCISQGYASAGLYPARFSSALTHSTLRLHDGTPSSLHTARIRTGHDSGTASPSAHSTLSPPAPVYPSPEHGTPAAASLHTPGWQGT